MSSGKLLFEEETSETEPPADPTPSFKLEPAPLPSVNAWFKQNGNYYFIYLSWFI